MKTTNLDQNKKDFKENVCDSLPEENEFIILSDGSIIFDEESSIQLEGILIDSVLVGC